MPWPQRRNGCHLNAYRREGRTPSRAELDVEITRPPKTLPYVPTRPEWKQEASLKRYPGGRSE
jgi:hypothetical protein